MAKLSLSILARYYSMPKLRLSIMERYYGEAQLVNPGKIIWRGLDYQFWQDTMAKLFLSILARYYRIDKQNFAIVSYQD
jgi:hypothetical protein